MRGGTIYETAPQPPLDPLPLVPRADPPGTRQERPLLLRQVQAGARRPCAGVEAGREKEWMKNFIDKLNTVCKMTKQMPITKSVRVIDHVATGRAYRTLRRAQEITLDDVAASMGISIVYLSLLERGKRNWSHDLCERFQKALKK